MTKLLFSISFFSIFLANTILAKPELIKIDNEVLYDVSTRVEWFIDEGAKFNSDDLLAGKLENHFNPPPSKMLNFGHLNDPVWCRFTILNLISEDLYLEFQNAQLDSISIYIFDQEGELLYFQKTGDYVPSYERKIQAHNFFFNLHTRPGEQHTIYLRTRSVASSQFFPLYVSQLNIFYNKSFKEDVLQGMYFGIILFIFIYNLFLFLILKRPEYIYFSIFVLFLGLMSAIHDGYAIQFLWGNQTWLNQLLGIVSALAGIFIILFTSTLLKSKEKTPGRHIWLLALIGIYLMSIIIHLLGASLIAQRFVLYNAFITFIFILTTAYKAWRNGFKPAGYYFIAWSFFLAGIIIFVLRDFDILPTNNITAHAFQIGSTLAILLISFTLGKKINIYIDKRNEARNLATKTSEENERLVKFQNQLLEERVNQRTKDLEQTVHSLQQQRKELKLANQFKDKVFTMISHDLKSPLSTLGGLLNVLQMGNLSESDKTRILNNIRLSLKNTHNILDNILEWATKRQDQDKTLEKFNMHHVVEEMITLFSVQLDTKSISLINKVESDTWIDADKNMIQLVLRNLISNAIKFTDEGGKISIMLESTDSIFNIHVQDTGIGISQEDQNKLFNDQNHHTTRGTNNEKGTGLGLLLCKEFVEKNGGAIELTSQKGKGSTFTIKLEKGLVISEEIIE